MTEVCCGNETAHRHLNSQAGAEGGGGRRRRLRKEEEEEESQKNWPRAPHHSTQRRTVGRRMRVALTRGDMAAQGVWPRPCAFSPGVAPYFAVASADGRLNVWESSSGSLHQEFVPSSHLSAMCTCVAWAPIRNGSETPRRKKRKSETVERMVERTAELNLLALGTATGVVMLYSVVRGKLHCKLDGGHTAQVNCIRWHQEAASLFSCSADKFIVEWNVIDAVVKSKWKGDKSCVTALCISPDGHSLLSAGRSIKLWDIASKSLLQTFTGHATAVTMLAFATHAPPSSETSDGISGLYFTSCAEDDRFVNVWHVQSGKQDISAALMLALPDVPLSLDLVRPEKQNGMLKVGVICKDGRLLLFQHTLNGKCKKPLTPDCILQIATESGGEASPMALLSVVFCAEPSCLFLAYGSPMHPVLERVKADMSEPHICLVRDDPLLSNIQMKIAVTKMKTPLVKDSKVLVPGLPGHTRRSGSMGKQKSQRGWKRKGMEDNVGVSGQEQSLEARLSSLEMCEPSPSKQDTTELTDFNVLLSQALESNDPSLLNKVLQMKQDSLVYSTVTHLPIQMVLPLIQVVTKRLQAHPRRCSIGLRYFD
uniref:WD repeat domain 43 n=1 Tax=Eptatretus burgeri TaxID=7764 RepID=A0A8C4R9F0_EPTBU